MSGLRRAVAQLGKLKIGWANGGDTRGAFRSLPFEEQVLCVVDDLQTHFWPAMLNTQFWAGNPWQIMEMDHDPRSGIGVGLHGSDAELCNR